MNGAIILAKNKTVFPNTEIKEEVNQAGFPSLSLSEFKRKCGTKKIEILNQVETIGYLKYVKKNEKIDVSKNDILIYKVTPKRIPPVRGIITLQPQTPLSHINILAKNRKTLNISIESLKAIPNLENNIGYLTKIEFKNGNVYLSKTSEKEAKKLWTKQKKIVEIPSTNQKIKTLIDLKKIEYTKTTIIGSKASNYAQLKSLIPNNVKEGFAIPFYYYHQVMQESNIKELMKELNSLNERDTINKVLYQIRRHIKKSVIDTNLLNQLKQLIETKYNKQKIRLRSSTNCEDLPDFNGAGLYISKGFKYESPKNRYHTIQRRLEKKILEVYASLWSELAFWEREFYLIDHEKAAMAILINPAFTNEYANGVAITIPSKEEDYSISINSQSGENSVTNPDIEDLPEHIFFSSKNSDKYQLRSKSNINPVFEFENQEKLLELKKCIARVHQEFTKNHPSYGIDIEYKLMKEGNSIKLYIKQARLLNNVLPE